MIEQALRSINKESLNSIYISNLWHAVSSHKAKILHGNNNVLFRRWGQMPLKFLAFQASEVSTLQFRKDNHKQNLYCRVS